MLLVYTDFPSFDDYLAALSKPARKNFKYVQKHNADLIYERIPFDKEQVKRFMALWERQLIRGKCVQWAFPVEHVEGIEIEGRLMCFAARRGEETLALHFVEDRGTHIECHPPMYDKGHADRYLAKFMWFGLIRYAIENNLSMLDLGGGPDDWRDHITNRAQYPNPTYKWIYVPETVKRHPELQPRYVKHENRIREVN